MPKGDEPMPDFAVSPPAREGCTPHEPAVGTQANARIVQNCLTVWVCLAAALGSQIFGNAVTTSKSGISDGSCFGLRRTVPVMGAFCSGSISRCACGRLAHWAVKFQSHCVRVLTLPTAVFAG